MKYEVTKDPSIFVGEYLKLQQADSLPIYFFVKEIDRSYKNEDGQYIMLEGIGYRYVVCGPNMKGINHKEAHIYTYFQIFILHLFHLLQQCSHQNEWNHQSHKALNRA